jgi:hypothetical protein
MTSCPLGLGKDLGEWRARCTWKQCHCDGMRLDLEHVIALLNQFLPPRGFPVPWRSIVASCTSHAQQMS